MVARPLPRGQIWKSFSCCRELNVCVILPGVQVDDRAPLRGLHVLIVEDDADSRYVLSMLVQAAGASVTAAEDGEAARAILERQPVDVVVSDIAMPRRDGF